MKGPRIVAATVRKAEDGVLIWDRSGVALNIDVRVYLLSDDGTKKIT